jgi:hypothetical protein
MESLKRHAELAGEEEPKLIVVVARVTTERWEMETLEFQWECELAKEHKHEQTVVAWQASMADSPSRTPEDITS